MGSLPSEYLNLFLKKVNEQYDSQFSTTLTLRNMPNSNPSRYYAQAQQITPCAQPITPGVSSNTEIPQKYIAAQEKNPLKNHKTLSETPHSIPIKTLDFNMLESTNQNYVGYFEAKEKEDSNECIFDDFSNGKRKRSSSEFDIYMEKMEEFMEKASFIYQAKENAYLDLGTNQQLLYIELLKQDTTIQNLNKARFEEEEKSIKKIYKLERELGQMGKLLKGYRDSLEKINQAFAQYRARARCAKDIIERVIIEFEMEWVASLEPHNIRLNAMDKRLLHVEKQVKIIKDLIAKRKLQKNLLQLKNNNA